MTDAELANAAIAALEAELGRILTDVERVQAEQRVKGALVVIRGRLGADLSALDQDALVYVLSEVLLARSRNPEGFQSESIDDYTYRHGTESRRVTILPEWWDLLSPTTESNAFSTRPGFEPDSFPPDVWTDTTTILP